MKGIYLASRKHRIKEANLDYNDIIQYEGINKLGDMMNVNLIIRLFLETIGAI